MAYVELDAAADAELRQAVRDVAGRNTVPQVRAWPMSSPSLMHPRGPARHTERCTPFCHADFRGGQEPGRVGRPGRCAGVRRLPSSTSRGHGAAGPRAAHRAAPGVRAPRCKGGHAPTAQRGCRSLTPVALLGTRAPRVQVVEKVAAAQRAAGAPGGGAAEPQRDEGLQALQALLADPTAGIQRTQRGIR